jgi:hypothetical protein
MSGFDFPSAPGGGFGGGFHAPMVDAAVFKWSMNQLFGTDATTNAVKAQTRMHEKQFRYERGLNNLNLFTQNFNDCLTHCLGALTSTQAEVNDIYDLTFLIEKAEAIAPMINALRQGTLGLLGKGDFKRADRFFSENLNHVVEPLARLKALTDFLTNTARSLQGQRDTLLRTFYNSDNREWIMETTPRIGKEIIRDLEDLAVSGSWGNDLTFEDENLVKVAMELQEIVELQNQCCEIFDEAMTAGSRYGQLDSVIWMGFVDGRVAGPEVQAELVEKFTAILELEEQWLEKSKILKPSMARIQEKVADHRLALALKTANSGVKNLVNQNIDALTKLADLLDRGLISAEEFSDQKKKLL